jgi:hypothetical protein
MITTLYLCFKITYEITVRNQFVAKGSTYIGKYCTPLSAPALRMLFEDSIYKWEETKRKMGKKGEEPGN